MQKHVLITNNSKINNFSMPRHAFCKNSHNKLSYLVQTIPEIQLSALQHGKEELSSQDETHSMEETLALKIYVKFTK